jgi:DNA-binding beta-propeller fold protein YncE
MTIFNGTAPAVPEAATPLPAGDGSVAGEVAPAKMSKKRKGILAGLLVALVILALLFAWYLMNRKPLSELPGLSQAKVPHYEFSIYGTTQPVGVAVSPTGDRIYVTQSGGQGLVRVYDHAGKQVGTLTPPSSTGPTHVTTYVAIDPTNQDVYVSDRSTSKIYIYSAKGAYLRTFAPKGNLGGAWEPLGLGFGPDGTLYVTDVRGTSTTKATTATAHRVLVFSPSGALVRSIGLADKLSFPNGIVVDQHGNIDVADSNNGRLLIFNAAGKILAQVGHGIGSGDLGMPRGVAADGAGRLYVVDTAAQMVRIYNDASSKVATPTFIGSFGTEGQLDGTFEYPNGVATDTRAHIYITDRENNRVQVWGY